VALSETQRKLEEAQLKIQQLHDINGNYTAEVKIQKRINAKLKKEMDVVSDKAKSLETDLEGEKEKNEMVY
jgi:DNA repair exonuclease SbcCD ATPase subunit